jgi:hypothetical protein
VIFQVFAVTVGGFSVMDNHLHVLLLLDPNVAEAEGRCQETTELPSRPLYFQLFVTT